MSAVGTVHIAVMHGDGFKGLKSVVTILSEATLLFVSLSSFSTD
jgi:hypothetical protein